MDECDRIDIQDMPRGHRHLSFPRGPSQTGQLRKIIQLQTKGHFSLVTLRAGKKRRAGEEKKGKSVGDQEPIKLSFNAQ